MRTEHEWCNEPANITGLAGWLDDECSAFPSVAACIHFFEQPWHWSREFLLWELWIDETESTVRELCIEAVDDKRKTAEDVRAEMEEAAL